MSHTTELSLPGELIASVSGPLAGLPACVAGSLVASETYGLPAGEYADVDVFCYTIESLITALNKLQHEGFALDERNDRVLHRWLRYGMGNWHTNSIKMTDELSGIEVNLVYKLLNRNPVTSLAEVLESFDFGLLATGYDLELGVKQDMRSFLFPGYDIDGPLPLMPRKRDGWLGGFISQYNGLREMGRYAKYHHYGHDMSLVKDDLVTGYRAAASYFGGRSESEKQQLAQIYWLAADLIEDDDLQKLLDAGMKLPTLDSLDAVMEALE